MQLFSVDATIFCPQKVEKNHPQKLLRKSQITFLALLPWAAQTAQNVDHKPTVFETGITVCYVVHTADAVVRL